MTFFSPATDSSPLRGRLTRRGFIIGAAATGVLAACGSSDADTESDDTTGTSPGGSPAPMAAGSFTLVQRFPQNVQ